MEPEYKIRKVFQMNLNNMISTLRYMETAIGNGAKISARITDEGFLELRAFWEEPKLVFPYWFDEITILNIQDERILIESFIKEAKEGFKLATCPICDGLGDVVRHESIEECTECAGTGLNSATYTKGTP
jgi:hypothetical protein